MSIRKAFMQALLALHLLCLAHGPALAEPAAQAIPFKQEAVSGAGELLRVAGGLTLCVLLLAGVLHFLRRRAGPHANSAAEAGRLRIVERQRLGARSILVVVEFDGKRHLLAQSEQGVALLATDSGVSQGDRSQD